MTDMSRLIRSTQKLFSSVYTIFLFTKSDTPLVVVPTVVIAMALAGPTNWSSFITALLWIELHLLTHNVKNQMIGLKEDKLCKPHRPFASGRIPMEHGNVLYLFVMATTVAFSAYHQLTFVSLAYMLAIWLYNERGFSKSLILKTPFGGFAYVCYSWGTTFIVGHHQPLSNRSMIGILSSGFIFAMTGYAQDFRDRSGDAAIGRKTIPLVLPQAIARWSLLIQIWGFTYGFILLWNPPLYAAAVFAFIGVTSSIKFVGTDSEEVDRKSFYCQYESWILCAHVLPIFERLSNNEVTLPWYSA